MIQCSVENCENPSHARGMCSKYYAQERRKTREVNLNDKNSV